MNLATDILLRGVAGALDTQLRPALEDPFLANVAAMAAAIVTVAAQGIDDAAALRVAENAGMRALLGEARDIVSEPLATRLAEAASSTDPGLRISELDAENGRLRALLVALHADLDDRDDDEAARALGRRIWRLLDAMEERRAPRG